MGKYDSIIGRRFKPTFFSIIDHYEIRGYDEERQMVLTWVYPKGKGERFEDEIEEKYLIGAFETGEYEVIDDSPSEPKTFVLHNHNYDMSKPRKRQQLFNCPVCNRCVHRFGTTSNRQWCMKHIGNDKCYRFKLDR